MTAAKRKAEQLRIPSDDKRRRRNARDDDEDFVPSGAFIHRMETRRKGGGKPSITISASQYARRVDAPNRLSIPTPGYRLVSELESEESVDCNSDSEGSPRRKESTAFPYTFYAYGCAVSVLEPVVDRIQVQKQIYEDLMKNLGVSLRSVMQDKWECMNSFPGMQLKFSEASFVLSRLGITAIHRSLMITKKAVLLASRERRAGMKRKMLQSESSKKQKVLAPRGGKDLLMLRNSLNLSDVEAEDSGSTAHRGAKCWSGWMVESARRTKRAAAARRAASRRHQSKKTTTRKKSSRRSARKRQQQEKLQQQRPVYRSRRRQQQLEQIEAEVEDTQVSDCYEEQETAARGVGKAVFHRILDRGCVCNILVIEFDRGWREYGATVELGPGDRGRNCSLTVLLQGETLFSQEIRQSVFNHTVNPFTGAYMWRAEKNWILEFKNSFQFNAFKKLHEECFENNYNAAVKKMSAKPRKAFPVPKFREVKPLDPRWRGPAFIRPPNRYLEGSHIDFDSRTLYDMDSEDEEWLNKLNSRPGMYKQKISEQKFEKVIYTLEKYSHARNELLLSADAASEVCLHVASLKIISVIHQYWIAKRQRRGLSLVRHFQPERWLQYRRKHKSVESSARENHVFAFCMPPRGLEVPIEQPTTSAEASSGITANASSPEQLPYEHEPEDSPSAAVETEHTCTAKTTDASSGEVHQGHRFEVLTLDGAPPQQGQLVLKKFVGRPSAEELKRLRLWRKLQQSGIKHFQKRACVPVMPPAGQNSDQDIADSEALLSLRQETGELLALADAAILNDKNNASASDSEATATASQRGCGEDRAGFAEVNKPFSADAVVGPETPETEDREAPAGSPAAQDQSAEVTEEDELPQPRSPEQPQVQQRRQRQQQRQHNKNKSSLSCTPVTLRPRRDKSTTKRKPQKSGKRQKPSTRKKSKLSKARTTKTALKDDYAAWSADIQRAVDKLKQHSKKQHSKKQQQQQRQQQQPQQQPQQQQQQHGPLCIRRIPRMTAR